MDQGQGLQVRDLGEKPKSPYTNLLYAMEWQPMIVHASHVIEQDQKKKQKTREREKPLEKRRRCMSDERKNGIIEEAFRLFPLVGSTSGGQMGRKEAGGPSEEAGGETVAF